MDTVEFREYCLRKPKVTEGTPFGETVLVFKVAGNMFALMSLEEVPATANLKCDPDLALDLRDRYEQVRPGYHINKKHWNTVEIEGLPDRELRKMIDHFPQFSIGKTFDLDRVPMLLVNVITGTHLLVAIA